MDGVLLLTLLLVIWFLLLKKFFFSFLLWGGGVETSIHLLIISHPSAGRTQRQDDLFRGLYLPTKPFFTNRTAAHGRASSQVNEVNNCTQLYNRAKNTYARGHMHPTINQSMFTYVSIYHYSSDIYSSKFSKTEHSSTYSPLLDPLGFKHSPSLPARVQSRNSPSWSISNYFR